jgi:hypothetical protein
MDPVHILRLTEQGFLYLLLTIIVLKLLTRRINLSGLFGRKSGTGQVSPERIQLLLATLALSVKYLNDVVHSSNGAMPDISANWLYTFGGSSGIYASVKALTTLKSR